MSSFLTLSPRNADNPALWYLFYSPKADIPALLNMPNTPKAEILACPSRAYPRMACISAGELRGERVNGISAHIRIFSALQW